MFNREKTRWCRGTLAAHASPTAADELPGAPASLDQLERAYWVGCNWSQLGKEVGTTLHIPEHAYTSQRMPATCRHKPKHARTFLHDPTPGTAFSEQQAVVRTILTSLDAPLFAFSGRGDGEIRPKRKREKLIVR